MDWTTILLSTISAIIGGVIALLGSIIATKGQNEALKQQLAKQQVLFDQQITYSEKEKTESVRRRKQEAASLFYFLIPSIAYEGFCCRKDHSYFATSIFANYDYSSALNAIRDELTVDEILYMTLLVGNIHAISRYAEKSEYFYNTYLKLLSGICEGYPGCGKYYAFNYNGRKGLLPVAKIESLPDNITTDSIKGDSYSSFFNNDGNCIYDKIKKIIDSGTAK